MTPDRAEQIWENAGWFTIRIADAMREWATQQGHSANQSILAHSMAIGVLADGARVASEGLGASAILALPYGDRLAEASELLRDAADQIDSIIKAGAS